ncbi:MAG: ABC transporter substrate-binding protein [Chloroflexi bacterium]|nr:ABC transporter substrate-binding protein [Chloroflexota bacterium]
MPSTPTAETPRRGGTLIVSLAADPPHFDIHQQATSLTGVITAPVYNKLLSYDLATASKLVPDLAERWEATPDGLSFRFTIRAGVKSHDGQPFTAEDAAFNVQLLADPPKGTISNMSSLLKPTFKAVAVESGNVVRADFKEPYAPFLALLSTDYAPIYPKRVVEANGDMKKTPLGTGPFKFQSYTPGVSVELIRNPAYWKAARPYMDGVSFRVIKDPATRLAALRTGQVHLTGRAFSTLTVSEKETVQREVPNMNFFPSASLRGPWFFMNLRKPPFSDARVRRAVHLALDRNAALKVIAEGQGLAGNFFPYEGWGLSQDVLGSRPGFRQPKDADLAEAKKLLADAGFPSGFSVTILSRTNELTRKSAVFMAGQLQAIGVKAEVRVLEDALFFDSGRKAQHEAMVYTPGATIPDPVWIGSFFVKGGSFNFAGNDDDARLNTLWTEQVRTLDEAKRKGLVRQTEEYLWEALPAIPIAWVFEFLATAPQVRGVARGRSDIAENSLEEVWLAR